MPSTRSASGRFRLPRGPLLRSRFGRRLLLLFIGCALIPTGAVALLSFRSVTAQLTNQSQERLRALASAAGKSLYDRLVLVESDVRKLGAQVAACRVGGPAPRRVVCGEAPLYELDGLTVVPDLAPNIHTTGDSGIRDGLAIGELPEVGPGQSAVLVRRDRSGGVQVYLVHRSSDPATRSRRLVGRVSGDFLWGATGDGLPATVAATLWDPAAGALFGNAEDSLWSSSPVARGMARAATGTFEWQGASGQFFAAYWSLPRTLRFRLPRWRVVMSESKADVMAPMADFTRTFPLILGASVAIVLVLGLSQIRRSLVPLEELRQGTLRIAGRDFDARVTIASGDEIEDLARAFNGMASQLGRQFSTLKTVAEIDRAVLSSVDTASIVDTVLGRLPDACPCEALSLTVFDRRSASAMTWVELGPGEGNRTFATTGVRAEDLYYAGEHRERFVVGGGAGPPVPEYLARLGGTGDAAIEAFPLFYGEDPLGVLALRRDAVTGGGEDLQEVRRLADQVAVALSNARMVEQVRHMAFYDSLTQLPNRVLYRERLGQALIQAHRARRLVAVCFLDLDHFSQVNDSLGHDLGDRLIQDVATRLLGCCRTGDSVARVGGGDEGAVEVARLGGDEFTVVLSDVREPQDAVLVARRILATFAQPFRLGTQEIFVTASIGIAIFPFDGLDTEDLLKNADVAMYHAKEQGGNTARLFSASMNADAVARMRLEQQLRKAVDAGEFTVWYQPIMDLGTGQVVGAEALVRWEHPERGTVSPGEFIALTEECGLIVPLGEWILRTVCAQARAWESAGLGSLRMWVNLSGRQLRQEGLVETVRGILTETGLAPAALVLELTESMLMDPGVGLSATLEALAGLGVGLTIDDFGTGYSSLSYLKYFPVSSLKIDRSFVREVTRSADDAAITAAIIALAGPLGMRVVAEGVETPEQAALLRAQGCHMLQGYLVGRPARATGFQAYLREWRGWKGVISVP